MDRIEVRNRVLVPCSPIRNVNPLPFTAAVDDMMDTSIDDIIMADMDESVDDMDVDRPFPYVASLNAIIMEDVQGDSSDMNVDFEATLNLPDSQSPLILGGWPVSTFMPSLITYVDEDEEQEVIPYSWSCDDIYELPWESTTTTSQGYSQERELATWSSNTPFAPEPIYPWIQLEWEPCNFSENTYVGGFQEYNVDSLSQNIASTADNGPEMTKRTSLLNIKEDTNTPLSVCDAETSLSAADDAQDDASTDDIAKRPQSPRLFSFRKPFEFSYLSLFDEKLLYQDLLDRLKRKPHYEAPGIISWVAKTVDPESKEALSNASGASSTMSPSYDENLSSERTVVRQAVYPTQEEVTPRPIRTFQMSNPNQDPFGMSSSSIITFSIHLPPLG